MKRAETGRYWEGRAEAYLRRAGLKPLARNFRCRSGEIDLIMSHGDTTVFVEVRYRGPGSRASGLESVTASKQSRIARAAGRFLTRHPRLAAGPCRFDVVAVDRSGRETELAWVRNAFESPMS